MGEAAEKLAASDPHAVANVSIETQLAVERFLARQAEVLDEKRWDDWLALFTAVSYTHLTLPTICSV